MTLTTLYKTTLFGWRFTTQVEIFKGFYLIDIPIIGWLFGNSYKIYGATMHQVVDVMYDTYAVVYECTNGPLWMWHENNAVLLSRTPYLNQLYYFRASDILRDLNYRGEKEWAEDMGKDCFQGVEGLG